LEQPIEPRRLTLPRFDAEAFGRWSEGIARFMGTAKFLVYMTVVIVAWIAWNALAPSRLRFDPYTFTFLTLLLSLQASYAAPLILLAQNRQADRDRLAMEEDRRRAAMQKADTEYLSRELASLRIALGEVATRDFIRSELTRLTEELDEAEQRRAKLDRRHRRAGRSGGKSSDEDSGLGDQLGATTEPHDEVDSDAPIRPTGASRRRGNAPTRAATDTDGPADPSGAAGADGPGNPGEARKSPRAPRGEARGVTRQ
jgi:uncharacterized membrane protein